MQCFNFITMHIFCSLSYKEKDQVEKWLIPSLLRQKKIRNLYVSVINYSGHKKIFSHKSSVGDVTVNEVKNTKGEMGFGEAHNYLFSKVRPKDWFFIVNPDVYLHENCLYELMQSAKYSRGAAIIEARQMPFAHPKEYDKETGETPWASGFGMLIKSKFFNEVGGFDENLWMYCEDVDLSWRAWINNYRVIYQPLAGAYHFTGNYFGYRTDRFYLEHFWSARNFLYLSAKFFGSKGLDKAKQYFDAQGYPPHFIREVWCNFNSVDQSKIRDFYYENKNTIENIKHIKIIGFNQFYEINSQI